MKMEQFKGTWWNNLRLLTGVVLVVLSFVIGFYSKIYIVAKFYEPISVLTGFSVYAVSWIILFIGAFMIGWETVHLMQQKIRHGVKATMRQTYDYTRQLPKKSIEYSKEFGKKIRQKKDD